MPNFLSSEIKSLRSWAVLNLQRKLPLPASKFLTDLSQITTPVFSQSFVSLATVLSAPAGKITSTRNVSAIAMPPFYCPDVVDYICNESISQAIGSLGWLTGFEPVTSGSTGRRSTPELQPPCLRQRIVGIILYFGKN